MSIKIGGYNFDGPYSNTYSLQDSSGVYAILCKNAKSDNYSLVDIGESATVKSRVENHDRSKCWEEYCLDSISYAVLYTLKKQKSGREEIEQELRKKYNPPCGIR